MYKGTSISQAVGGYGRSALETNRFYKYRNVSSRRGIENLMNAEALIGTVLGTCTLQKLVGQGGM